MTPMCLRVRWQAPAPSGFMHEVEELRAKGLIQGASTQNAVLLDATTGRGRSAALAGRIPAAQSA